MYETIDPIWMVTLEESGQDVAPASVTPIFLIKPHVLKVAQHKGERDGGSSVHPATLRTLPRVTFLCSWVGTHTYAGLTHTCCRMQVSLMNAIEILTCIATGGGEEEEEARGSTESYVIWETGSHQ